MTHRIFLLRAAQLAALEQGVLRGHHHVGDAKQRVWPGGKGGQRGRRCGVGWATAAAAQPKGDVCTLGAAAARR